MDSMSRSLSRTLRRTFGVVITAMALALTAGPASAAESDAWGCNRDCLNRVMETYLRGLEKHDPRGVPVAANLRASENAQLIKLGAEGAWTQITRLYPGYLHADPVTGQVVHGGAVDGPRGVAALFVRLKVRNRRIVESEVIFSQGKAEGPAPPFEAARLVDTDVLYDAIVPVARRSSRAQLRQMVDKYVNALSHRNADASLFSYRCDRYATGLKTTNNKNLTTDECPAALAIVTGEPVLSHTVPVIDVERGLAWAIFYRPHPEYSPQFVTYAAEMFKIVDGKIRSIDILGDVRPSIQTKPLFTE